MPVFQGTYFTKTFILKDRTTELPIDVTGYEFSCDIRDNIDDDTPLLELTTAGGGIVVGSTPGNGEVVLNLTAVQTAALPEARLHFDVLRTDITPGPRWLFGGRFRVKQPVTRDD